MSQEGLKHGESLGRASQLRLDMVSRVVILLAGLFKLRLKRVSGVVNLLAGLVKLRFKRVSRGASLLSGPVKWRLKRDSRGRKGVVRARPVASQEGFKGVEACVQGQAGGVSRGSQAGGSVLSG